MHLHANALISYSTNTLSIDIRLELVKRTKKQSNEVESSTRSSFKEKSLSSGDQYYVALLSYYFENILIRYIYI